MGDAISDVGDFVSDAWDTVVTVASIVPGPWQAPALLYKGIDALSNGNIIGAGMAAYGFNGAGGMDFGGFNPATDGYGMGTSDYYGSSDAFGGDAGGNWNYDYGNSADYFANVDNSLGNMFSDNYTQGANEFVKNWGDNPTLNLSNGGTDIANMSQGLGQFPTSGANISSAGDGVNTSALSQDNVMALSGQNTDPLSQTNFSPDAVGVPTANPQQTSTLENITSSDYTPSYDTSLRGPDQVGVQPQKYTYENKDFFGGKTGSGLNVDTSNMDIYKPDLANAGTAQPFKQGLEVNNLPDIYSKLTTPVGIGKNRSPTPLEWGGKIAGGLGNMYANKQAMDVMKQHFNAANNWTDPNRERGNFANQEWQKNQSDPMYGYDSFMAGAGRDFVDKARAVAAKSGNRGGYINSGRMNTDLASLWQKNQSQRADSLRGGFANGVNNYAATASAAPGYASLVKNQLSPLGDLFGQWERYNQMAGE